MKTIEQIQKQLQNGETNSVALVEAAIADIKSKNSNQAAISLIEDQSIEWATTQDTNRAQGIIASPLAGIPIAIKDNINITGVKTTCGSMMLENFTSPYTATSTMKLLEAGAIPVAKANMDEFAMGSTSESSFFGTTINPTYPELIPGGSSGGSAALVAQNSVAIALGSDTGGSIRQPAACTGIVGVKPTYGRVSRYGLVSYASSLDQIGPLSHTVHDSALVLNAICGHDPHDVTSSAEEVPDFTALLNHDIKGKVIGIPQEYFGEGLDPEIKETITQALDELKAQGAVLKEVNLSSLKYAISSYYVLATAEASSNLSRFDGVRYTHRTDNPKNLMDLYCKSRSEGFGEEVKRRILLGTFVLSSGYYDAYYMQAQRVRRVIRDDFAKAFEHCDVLVAPTLPSSPMKLGEGLADPMAMYLSDIYTVSLNLAGLPGISLPCGETAGVKTGLQIFSKAFDEQTMLQMAAAVERNQ